MIPGEEPEVCALVNRVFDVRVATEYTEEGVRTFLAYVESENLAKRVQHDHFVLVAELRGALVGMIEMRKSAHVSLLFVEVPAQRKGIGRELLRRSLLLSHENRPEVEKITVHSAPSAVPAYEGLGFHITGSEQMEHGIRFIPMILDLTRRD